MSPQIDNIIPLQSLGPLASLLVGHALVAHLVHCINLT
jgi:hypothetical protein